MQTVLNLTFLYYKPFQSNLFLHQLKIFSCNEGDHDSAFQFFINQGVVSGGQYHTHKTCKPYQISPDETAPRPTNINCKAKCDSPYSKSYSLDKIYGKDQVVFSRSNADVMNELKESGSLVAEFKLFEDFLHYSNGIYQHVTGRFLGYHYVELVGWSNTID